MNWQEALAEIESAEFDAQVNVVSNLRGFLRAAARESAVTELCRYLSASGEAREETLGHIYDLSSSEIDARYENPNDTALAVLLWLIYYAVSQQFANSAAHYVLRAPNCWYARKLANTILIPHTAESVDVRVENSHPSYSLTNSSAPVSTMHMMDFGTKYRIAGKADLSLDASASQDISLGEAP